MFQPGQSFENPRTGTRMNILEWAEERVRFERTYPPDTGFTDPHIHFDISQSWEVLEGEAMCRIEEDDHEVRAGELIEVPTGTRHRDIYNASENDLRVRWTVSPNNAFVEAFADCYTHYLTRGRLNSQDEFKPLQLFPILHGTKAASYIATIPIPLQKALIPVGALSGRLRGYRSRYGDSAAAASRAT
jgi:mannose-6-phosphate isomerase-like protein (cupin superfamily)